MLDIMILLRKFHSADIPDNVLKEMINRVKKPETSRTQTIGRVTQKFLVALDLFIDSGNHDEGYMTRSSEEKYSRKGMSTDACQRDFDGFVRSLFPGLNYKKMKRTIVRVSHILIGAKAASREYFKAAKVTGSILGPFRNDIESRRSIVSRFQVTRHNTDKLTATRVSDLGDLRLVEAALGYCFKDIRLLEDALSHLSRTVSLQGLSCQRLEYLGDALLDIYVTEYWMDVLPAHSSRVEYFRMVSVDRSALSAAAANLCLECHLHHVDISKTSEVTRMVEDLVTAKWENKLSDIKSPYWNRVHITSKVLCDVFESVIGAVFVDTDFDLDETRKVFARTLRPILSECLVPK
ncbi:Dicer-like protein 2 [Mortierella sp. AD011]|nr:Dicer-like protein 2 [Mortierella sp. AD010]KAF9374543.1 Dicer-like protein 2 [Mortierella sp. AD011]